MATELQAGFYGPGADSLIENIVLNAGPNTYAMAALNAGCAMRFRSDTSSRKIYGFKISWGTITAAGTVTARIETIDATTGKPTGTLYDANASIAFTPVAGAQSLTFATAPTTNLTAGQTYALVLITTAAGTAHTLNSHTNTGGLPAILQTAADATVRSNLANVSPSVPICSFVLDDASESCFDAFPYTGLSNTQIYGVDLAWAAKFTTNVSMSVAGVLLNHPFQIGSPGDLRIRILDTGNTAVSGTTITLDKDYVAGMTSRTFRVKFDSPITLTAGTYRLVCDQNGGGDSSNYYSMRGVTTLAANVLPTSFRVSTSTNMSTTFTWTDSTTVLAAACLWIDGIPSQGGGGGAVNPINGLIVAR